MSHDIYWFVQDMGFVTRGVDVLSLIDYEVPTQEIEDFFGLKVSKNGYKHDRKVGAEVTKSVLELYKCMIGKQKVKNGQINKCFACGVVSWLKHGTELDWAKYVIYCDKYSFELREMKMVNLIRQAESGVVGVVKKAP
jgi:hypothetical protein